MRLNPKKALLAFLIPILAGTITPTRAASLEAMTEATRRKNAALWTELESRVENLTGRIAEDLQEAIEASRALGQEIRRAVREQVEQVGAGVVRWWNDLTGRRIVLGVIRVRGTATHAQARHGFWKGAWKAFNGEYPDLYKIVMFELRRKDDGLSRLKHAARRAYLAHWIRSGHDEPPEWVGYWVAEGKQWNRPIVRAATDTEKVELDPIFGAERPLRGN